jgi:hypothetical protein
MERDITRYKERNRMTQVTIPASIKDARASLNGLDKLLTAKGWERAAIVYAFTGADKPGPKGDRMDTQTISVREFAALGIAGLTDKNTVAEYRRAWGEHGTPDIRPGDTVTLPIDPWPPGTIDHKRGSHATVSEHREWMARNPDQVAQAAKAIPAVGEAVVLAVTNDPELASKHSRASFAHRPGERPDRTKIPPVSTPTTSIPDFTYDKEVDKAIRTVHEAMLKERDGTWKPDVGTNLLMTLLYLNLKDRAEAIEASRPPIFREIDEFLATARQGKEE